MFATARFLVSVLAAFSILAAPPVVAQTFGFMNTPKYAAIVVDAKTGEVLYAREPDAQRYPASLTKIMTLYLAFEALSTGALSPTDQIVVSPRAAAQAPTKIGLRAGETITVADALTAVSVKSANDIAVAVAEKIGGTESRFAALMTLRAHELGMTNTRFVNASGLPDSRQTTTARDLAILSRAVMRDYPQYYAYFGKRQFVYRGAVSNNHNGLLSKMPGVDGIKTGFINASGFNLAASAVRDGRRLITIVLGGNSVAARDAHVADLLEAGFKVMDRRAKGETITVAQTLYEPAPIGPLTRPTVEQGDGEQAGLRIVLTDDPPLRQAQKADAPKTAARGQAKGAWLVQVGAFKSRVQAQTHIQTMNKSFAGHFRDAPSRIEPPVNGFYRARFSGFTADGAKEACAALKAKKQNCMVVAPG